MEGDIRSIGRKEKEKEKEKGKKRKRTYVEDTQYGEADTNLSGRTDQMGQ